MEALDTWSGRKSLTAHFAVDLKKIAEAFRYVKNKICVSFQ